jgi:acetyl-CoA decarbonylase/synthase complex subunit gamma
MTWRDRVGAVRVRCGIRRMHYRVRPGLYAVGRPGPDAPVLVSSNYTLSFDHLRRSLAGRDAWILVLDTHGINVWCAAGKGHFSTDEVVRWVEAVSLSSRVSHRKLVLPQLAAPGVAAHEVKRRTGFRVVYGPVRAADIPRFLDARMTATPEMRQVRYRLRDRAVLVPVEVVTGAKYPLVAAAALLLVGSIGPHGLSMARAGSLGSAAAALTLLAFLSGAVLGPLLLPWLPGRAFALKGAALGAVVALVLAVLGWPSAAFHASWLATTAWALLIPALTSFVVMNFTGSSTYTSLSGVLREMRVAVPMQIAAGLIGIGLWVTALYGATV